MEAIESEVRRMESDVAEIRTLLSSPETLPSPREEGLKVRRKSEVVSSDIIFRIRKDQNLQMPNGGLF